MRVRGTIATNTLLEVRGLGRRDPQGTDWLLRNISFDVESSECLGVVGPSGAGKTILLRLMGLLDSPDEGEIRFLGQPVTDGGVPVYRSQVIYLHQRPSLFEGSVEHNLRLPYQLSVHHHHQFDRLGTIAALEKLDRPPAFLDRSTADLSGGEAQIVALLRAMQLNPLVLLLDEPTASADAETARSIEQLVRQWHEADARRALLFVSHQTEQIERWASRCLRLSQGRITEPLR